MSSTLTPKKGNPMDPTDAVVMSPNPNYAHERETDDDVYRCRWCQRLWTSKLFTVPCDPIPTSVPVALYGTDSSALRP